jgi:hypothetical protein
MVYTIVLPILFCEVLKSKRVRHGLTWAPWGQKRLYRGSKKAIELGSGKGLGRQEKREKLLPGEKREWEIEFPKQKNLESSKGLRLLNVASQ